MANSRYAYVKSYEQEDRILRECWIVIRLDGKGFTKFSVQHSFEKPNDERALSLMNACAVEVLKTFPDIKLGYGQSDEFSFVLHKCSTLYGRRSSKLVSLITSCFAASYVFKWTEYFPESPLQSIPCFDGRSVAYPNDQVLRDYLAWRQVDAHINNQFNTCFWALVEAGMSPEEAQQTLKGTQADFKNELLFSRFGINYSKLPAQFRKGTILYWQQCPAEEVKLLPDGGAVSKDKKLLTLAHVDIIGQTFWQEHPYILV